MHGSAVSAMSNKQMRPVIKLEDGEGDVQSNAGQEEQADAGRERRRRPNEGKAVAADEARSLLAVHTAAQAQAFGEMERARVMELELQQAKADVARLQVEAKLKDEAFQAKESLLQAIVRSKDESFQAFQALILSKDELLLQSRADVAKLQAALESKEAHVATLQATIQSKDKLLRSQLPGTKYVREVSMPPALLPPRLRPDACRAADGSSRRSHMGV